MEQEGPDILFSLVVEVICGKDDILNAAGTPIMRPLLPASSLARLTVLPGESSTSSTVGIESPALTMIAGVDENSLAVVIGWRRLRLIVLRMGWKICLENMVCRRVIQVRKWEGEDSRFVGRHGDG